MKKIFAFIFLFLFGFFFSQNIKDSEKKIIDAYNAISELKKNNENLDLFYKKSEEFSMLFKSFIKQNPRTIEYQFKELINNNICNISTSEDGKLRIYNWDTQTGGTMKNFDQIIQYKSSDKIYVAYSKNANNNAEFCSKIYSLNINDKMYYFPIYNGIYSTKDASQSISAYQIENSKLNQKVKLFKSKNKLLSSIFFEFDFFSVVDRPERPLELIKFDKENNTIYIPIVNEKGIVSNNFLIYQLKNNVFQYIGKK